VPKQVISYMCAKLSNGIFNLGSKEGAEAGMQTNSKAEVQTGAQEGAQRKMRQGAQAALYSSAQKSAQEGA